MRSDIHSSRIPLSPIRTMACWAVKLLQETNHSSLSPFYNSRSEVKVPTGDRVRH